MTTLVRLTCAIAVALTVGLGAVATGEVGVAAAQEEAATPPIDIETPPDQVQTSDTLPWGLLGLLGLLGLAPFVLRGPRQPTVAVDPRQVNQPPPVSDDRPRR